MTDGNRQAVVHIITGEVNSGKTTRLLSLYRKLGSGDGFACVKMYGNGRFVGQSIMRLSTGESAQISYMKDLIPTGWNEACVYENFSFSGKGLAFAVNIAGDIISNGIEPAFIDEIGPLELRKEGFSDIFRMLLMTKGEIYAVIRESCINSVIKEFGIRRYDIIPPVY